MRASPDRVVHADETDDRAAERADAATTEAASLLLSIPAAARLLSIGRSTVYELIWKGDLTAIKIGRCVRIRRRDLEAYVDRLAEGD